MFKIVIPAFHFDCLLTQVPKSLYVKPCSELVVVPHCYCTLALSKVYSWLIFQHYLKQKQFDCFFCHDTNSVCYVVRCMFSASKGAVCAPIPVQIQAYESWSMYFVVSEC